MAHVGDKCEVCQKHDLLPLRCVESREHVVGSMWGVETGVDRLLDRSTDQTTPPQNNNQTARQRIIQLRPVRGAVLHGAHPRGRARVHRPGCVARMCVCICVCM